ncbi:MATE family efflux transporter [Sedimentibacter sp. zth1]|uniref:MATE family efflux transporter n=1 Tax=Sedimentibacter sp. zth1 TaxID=2816908 RepID=UPI001A932028|nr:MATE family efflux transporter [Sedimentibacter sp. zth1]QSX04848.1 MATE family efflux transporter [Sedimentibacter sp. zth1]
MITDMTVGKPNKILWKFSIPMLISVMFQQMYNIADGMIAGKFAGEDALASVGASYPITMIFMAIAIGCNIGCSVIISNLFGAKDYKNMKTAVSTTFFTCLGLSTILTILGLVFCVPMMKAINTPNNIFGGSLLYLQIYIAGLIFLFFYNVCTGIFTALGDSKTPLYLLIGSSVGNVILDLIFVIQFKMGVAGVAIATLVAQGISSILAMITLRRRVTSIKCEEKYKVFSLSMLRKISIVAIPSILQQSFISIGNIFIQSIVNGFGSAVIAGYSSAIKLNTFSITSITTLASGLSNFTAQNMGAKKVERVYEGFKSAMLLVICVVVPFFIAFFIFSNQMISMFMDDSSIEALNVGVSFLKIVSPFYIVIAVKIMSDGVLRGAGSMKQFMISTFLDLILRVVLAFVLSGYFGTNGIWMSWPIGWTTSAIVSFLFYKNNGWAKKLE